VAIAAYLVVSLAYSLVLKHVPWPNWPACQRFVLRALGGAAATHVPPSGCSSPCAAWAR